jgi:tetratricopeptide (TPR) repeat protein
MRKKNGRSILSIDYAGAKAAYGASLALKQESGGGNRGEAVTKRQLGTLALLQGNLTEASQRYQEAIKTFQELGESAMEAVAWHQLGMVQQEARQWAAAEKAYRRSAELKESLGMITGSNGAVTTWNQLAIVNSLSGNAQEAESWYRKALERYKEPITY